VSPEPVTGINNALGIAAAANTKNQCYGKFSIDS